MLPVGMPHPAESQELIAVAAGNDLYLVVWTASAGHVPNIQGVRVRASDGAILDPTPLVISTGASPRLDPAVAFDGNNFLVVWTTIEGAPTLHGARVRASDGAVLDTPPLWLSRAGTPAGTMPQAHAAVAFDGSGNYLVTWEGTLVVNNTYSSGILGIRVRASDGTCVESTATLIGGGSGRDSRVAYAQGNFLVTWRKSINNNIEAARVSASTGQVLDTAPILLAAAAADPAVAARHDEFLVVWRGAEGGLWGRRVRAWDGAKLGTGDIAVGPAVAAPADVAFDGEDYWISWQGTRDGGRQALTTRVTAEGEVAADAELVLGEVPAGSAVQRGGIAAAGSGLVLSVYAVKDPVAALTRGRMRLVKAGQVHVSQELAPSIVSAHLGNFDHPAVAEGDGMYLVVWSQLRGSVPNIPEIVAVRVRASDGARLDATPLRLSGSSDIAASPDVAFDGSNFLVVWTDLRDTTILGARVRASDGAVLDSTPLLFSLPPWSPAGRTLGMNPTVAFDGTKYLVTWGGARTNSTGNMNGIMGIHVRPSDGWTFGWSSFVIVPVPFEDPGQNYSPEAAYTNGSYLLAWTRDGQVKATRVSASTGQVRDATPMSLGPTASIGDHSHAVAARGDEFLVLWRGTDGGLWGRRIRASDGVMLGTADIFVGPGLQGTPSATFDGADYRVAWPASRGGGTEVVFTRISPEGVVEADAEQSIVPLHAIADASQGPRIAAAGPGSFLVTYLQGYPVVGRRTRMRLVNAAPADCDSRVPTLTLNGSPELMLECGSGSYRDPGAVAFDGCGRPLQVHAYNTGQDESGPGPNLSVEGTYMVAYAAWDVGGHMANALRTVNVDDRTPPTLTLLGAAHMTHTCGSQWVDPGVQATDVCYGNITHQVWHTGEVNGWAEGTYTVTYTLTDSGGNSATPVTRTVDVLNCPW